LNRFFHRNSSRTHFATAGLLAGLMLPHIEWSIADVFDNRDCRKPVPPISVCHGSTDLLQEELKVLLSDLGVPTNNIPVDFVEKVQRWAYLYQTRDRDEMNLVLGPRRSDFHVVRQRLARANLPPDLAFVTLVESHFQPATKSPDDNAGLWQFTQNTARRNGLKVNAQVDERLDPNKSTEAACRYLLQLKRELGQEGSLMLVLAAYNMGPGRLKQRTKQVQDPVRRRDFWYLYRTRLLPAVTRTHLSRLMAAILIGRHPQYFGFKTGIPGNFEPFSSAVSRF